MTELFSTRALLAMQTAAFIAWHGQDGMPVKSSRIIERYQLNKRALEPILQTLSRGGVVESKQGASGGYLIADPQATLGDVAALFIDSPAPEQIGFSDWRPLLFPALEKAHYAALEPLHRLSLAALVEQAALHGISRTDDLPLDFII